MELFIARQPIFDAARDVVGYELLFRDGLKNLFSATDSNEATRQVLLNTFVLFGLNRLTGGKPAFINFTREFLLNDLVRLFPPQDIVVEVLEDVVPDAQVVAACRGLKEAGYTIALDDVVHLSACGDLLELADIVKIDFRQTNVEERGAIARAVGRRRLTLLAEKVESPEEFEAANAQGFTLFQGYFFAKPEVVKRRDVPGNRAHYLELLRELRKPNIELHEVAAIIKRDLSLSYRLLRYVNSPLFGLRAEVRSVQQALTLLGLQNVRRWAVLTTLSSAAPDKPPELLEVALSRARFCETLSSQIDGSQQAGEELFLMGLFSVLDALLDLPLQEALREACLPSRVKAALLGAPGPWRSVLDLTLAYERGEWGVASERMATLAVEPFAIARAFVDSVDWARRATQFQVEPSRSSLPARPA